MPAPRRTSLTLALTAIALLAAASVLGPAAPSALHWLITGAALGVAALTLRASAAPARAIAVLVAALLLAARLGAVWQLTMALGIGAWALLARALPSIAAGPNWRARGAIPIAATALVGGVTPFALVGWVVLAQPDLSDILAGYVPDLPLPVLVLGAIGFALINAVLEELIWRGVLYERLETLARAPVAIAITSLSFGLAHAHGFPRGVIGVVLAGSWAAMLGVLRHHTRGLAAPIVAHVVADATIATVVLVLASE